MARKATATKRETITTPDGTRYKVTEEGRDRLARPHWWHEKKIGTIPALAEPRAKRDRDVAAWAGRMAATFDRQRQRDEAGFRGPSSVADVIGKSAGGGYFVVSTDGYRALLRKGDPLKPETAVRRDGRALMSTCEQWWINVTDDLSLALRRMIAANDDQKAAVVLVLDARRHGLTLFTRDGHDYTEAAETVPVSGALRGMAITVNAKFLLDALGAPGQRLFLGTPRDGDKPIMLDVGEYRVLIMPMRGRQSDMRLPSWVSRPDYSSLPVAPPATAPVVKAGPTKARAARAAVASLPDDVASLSPAQKAARTRRLRLLAASTATPVPNPQPEVKTAPAVTPAAPAAAPRGGVDWVAAGRKAWETRKRNQAARQAAGAAA